jgi:diadenosine tetraphosphate (Ap4A) HIT family hydrolase
VKTWFGATRDEWHALSDAFAIATREVEQTHHPDGYSIGVNCGTATGQEVFELDAHLIRCYRGVNEGPRGGVRPVLTLVTPEEATPTPEVISFFAWIPREARPQRRGILHRQAEC